MKKKKKLSSYESKKQKSYLMFLIPFLIGFFLLFLGIYADSLRFSFSEIRLEGTEGYSLKNVGFENYKYAFLTDPDFIRNLQSSVLGMLSDVLVGTLFSLLVAVILNGKMKGRTVFRAIFFVPVILATGFVDKADEFAAVFSSQWDAMGSSGTTASVANGLISSTEITDILMESLSPEISNFIVSAVDSIFDIVNLSGVPILIFLAGLQSISPAIYEAADIDGASKWESFWWITFPMISPIILVNVVYIIVDSLSKPSNVIMQQIQEIGFSSSKMGVASAMAWVYFLIMAIMIGIFFFVISRYVHYQQKE